MSPVRCEVLLDLSFCSEQHIKEMEQLIEKSPRELYKRGEDFDSIYLSRVSYDLQLCSICHTTVF